MQDELKPTLYIFEIAAIFLDFGLGVLLARRTAKTMRCYIRKYYLCSEVYRANVQGTTVDYLSALFDDEVIDSEKVHL